MTLDLAGVRFGYRRGSPVLVDISLNIVGQQRVALLGPNGAGKSTLFKVITGQLRRSAGALSINGRDVDRRFRLRRGEIGLMPQDIGVLVGATVASQLAYCAWLAGLSRCEVDIHELLADVGLADRADSLSSSLSGGQRQRLGLVQALVARPAVVLLDEPTSGLDPLERQRFRSLLGTVVASSVVVATHLVDDLADTYDRVIVLDGGEVRFDGTVQEFLALVSVGDPHRAESAYARVLTDRSRAVGRR